MPYVIFNKQNNKYIKHPYTWVSRLSAATKFKTEENAKKFLTCPPRALALPSADDIEILSADNLTSNFNTNYTFTEETAQQEFEELKHKMYPIKWTRRAAEIPCCGHTETTAVP